MLAPLAWLFLHQRQDKGTPVLHQKLIKQFLLILLQMLLVTFTFPFSLLLIRWRF